MFMACLIVFALVGCAGQLPPPTLPAELPPTTEPSSPAPELTSSPTQPGVQPGSTSQPPPDVFYQDNFTNPGTGWDEVETADYFIGYHEPEYYHVEIKSPHLKAPVVGLPEPEQHSYSDATIELQVLTVSARTAPDGDFRYGLVFRRSGDQYYAFTISPRTKKWYVLKSSPSGLVTLQDGIEESMHDLDVDDLLRVDAQGPNFFFHINDRLVSQVTDTDYPSGEIGFYVENIDSPSTHIHFNTLTIREAELTLVCSISATTIYMRSEPRKSSPPLGVLSNGDTVEPLGISPDREWIKIKVEGSEVPGWIFKSEAFVSCNAPLDALPTVTP